VEIGKIGIIFVLAIAVTSRIFRYLITTNKIKKSKISKIFYEDDENFIESWKKSQEKGMLRYIFKYIILSTAIWVIMGIIYLLSKISMYGYEQDQTLFVALVMGVIYGLLFSLLSWGMDSDKYNRLVEKRNMKSDSINNDDKKIK
jgi:uncharacterized ion transporter superfamily protein YfcC